MTASKKYSREVRERAVRLVLDSQGQHESQWAAIKSVAVKIGCTAETLRKWIRQPERDSGWWAGQLGIVRRSSRTGPHELGRGAWQYRACEDPGAKRMRGRDTGDLKLSARYRLTHSKIRR